MPRKKILISEDSENSNMSDHELKNANIKLLKRLELQRTILNSLLDTQLSGSNINKEKNKESSVSEE